MSNALPGSGVGGDVGGSPTPLQRELEMTAWTQVNKANLGIVPDSIEHMITELVPRYQFGYLGAFGYRTSSSRALLDRPLEINRMPHYAAPQLQAPWEKIYQDLIDLLPPDVSNNLEQQMTLPINQRNSAYAAVNNIFIMWAQLTAQMQTAGKPAPPDSVENGRTTLNLLLPFAALKGGLVVGKDTGQGILAFLNERGPNYPYFDGFSNALGQFNDALDLLDIVNSSLTDTPEGQLNPQARAAASRAASLFGALNTQLGRVSLGNDLQLLRPTVNTLEIIANALSLPNTAMASLYLGLSIALNGIDNQNSPLALVGNDLGNVLNSLNDGLAATLFADAPPASQNLLKMLVTSSLIAFSTLAISTVNEGYGPLPNNEGQPTADDRFFAFETALSMINGSGLLQTLYQGAIDLSGGNAAAQVQGSQLLAPAALLFILSAAAQTGNQDFAALAERAREQFIPAAFLGSNLAATMNSEDAVTTGVFLQQAAIALEQHDPEGFTTAVVSLLESKGTTAKKVQYNLANLGATVENVTATAASINDDQPLTGVQTIV